MFNTHEIIVCLVYKKKSPKGDENGDLSPLLFTLFRVYKKKSPKGDEN